MSSRLGRAARLVGALLLLLAAAAFLYFAGFVVWTDVVPQIRRSGLSLEGSSRILNRDWAGNQLYLLVALYLAIAGALGAAAVRLARRRRS